MFKETNIVGLKIFDPVIHSDQRGYFFESYNKNMFKQAGITCEFVQDNQSKSEYGVLRGLHFQTGEHAQAKLARVLSGEVLDIAVDLRPNSKTFGKHFSIILSCKNQKQIFIPRGFAHGFLVLSKEAVFAYKCDNYYCQQAESGIHYKDPKLSIDWGIPEKDLIINSRDLALPSLDELSLVFNT